jgi:predicted xylose isomerase-like sugar epimerase
MTRPRMKFANLDEESLKKLTTLEEQMGTLILAVEPIYPFAQLKEEQIKKIQKLEEEFDIILLAFQH